MGPMKQLLCELESQSVFSAGAVIETVSEPVRSDP